MRAGGPGGGHGRSDYLEVRYENLILKTRETLERICTHAGLRYDDRMLGYHPRAPARLGEHKGRRGADGATLLTREQRFRQQERTTEPPDPACIIAWRRAMSAEERARFGLVAGDLLNELGYEV